MSEDPIGNDGNISVLRVFRNLMFVVVKRQTSILDLVQILVQPSLRLKT